MENGRIASGTRFSITVFESAFVASMLEEYEADNALPLVAVETPGSPTMRERLFVQITFRVDNDQDSRKENLVDRWVQLNSTNFPGLNAQFFANLKRLFDRRRTAQDMDPDQGAEPATARTRARQ